MLKRQERVDLFSRASIECSRELTRSYSTSFYRSVRLLAPDLRQAIFGIYGFVRLADEVVDSFGGADQERLLRQLREQTYRAIEDRISTNPILHAFQGVYHEYGFEREHVDHFLRSMECDLSERNYDRAGFDDYVLGSAQVVGLMCLRVFVRGDEDRYEELKPAAEHLGSAFQKINFLRDVREDFQELGRSYFPDVHVPTFDQEVKSRIEREIEDDLWIARTGIAQLPRDARLGVYVAFTYYSHLLRKIRKVPGLKILSTRIRLPDLQKTWLLLTAYARHRLNLI